MKSKLFSIVLVLSTSNVMAANNIDQHQYPGAAQFVTAVAVGTLAVLALKGVQVSLNELMKPIEIMNGYDENAKK